MPLQAGTRLAPYEVLSLIGAGGMGEVYRARDPRLGRDVAVKVLPAHYLTDPDRLERFHREARAAAALNHPNIVAIYDTGTSDGVPFIASELLTGTTLREALTTGIAWPTRKALDVAQQMARGLAAAHTRGIVHRDLKPENVFLGTDGVVKILDFGLARLKEGPVLPAAEEPTMPGTEAGRVLGTVGYMAPEQARGLPADHRADLFGFGAILYEMLAGRRAFIGDTAADTMTAILTQEPPEIINATHPVPPALERIVMRCLDKRPEARFQSASDLAFALESTSSTSSTGLDARTPVAPRVTRRQWLAGTAGLAAGAALGAVAHARLAPAPTAAQRATFLDIALPSGPEIRGTSDPILSPDGRQMAFGVFERGGNRLWIGSLDAPGFKRFSPEGFSGGVSWSPDGGYLGFHDGKRLKTLNVATGGVEVLAEIPEAAMWSGDGAWNSTGDIILAVQGLFHVPASGGPLKPLIMRDLARGEVFLGYPQFLPDGRHYLFTAFGRGAAPKEVCVGTLGSSARTPILLADSAGWYAEPGYLVFARGGTLFAQPFNADRLSLSGRPERIAAGLRKSSFGSAMDVSRKGNALVYITGDPVAFQFTWLDRAGRETGRLGDPMEAYTFDIATDGASAVMMVGLPGELWQMDTRRGGMSRLTDGADDCDPRLSADGKSVLFAGTYNGGRGLDLVSLQGGSRRRVYEAHQDALARLILHDWSRDGRFALCDVTGFHREVSAVRLSDGWRQVVVRSSGRPDQARFSPDGKWIAYNDLESERFEVFVVPFPPTGQRWQISTSGGVQPEWKGDGRELFYLDRSGTLMAVSILATPNFDAGPPRPLFRTSLIRGNSETEEYRVTADGQRFLFLMPVGGVATKTTLVQNWSALLKQ